MTKIKLPVKLSTLNHWTLQTIVPKVKDILANDPSYLLWCNNENIAYFTPITLIKIINATSLKALDWCDWDDRFDWPGQESLLSGR